MKHQNTVLLDKLYSDFSQGNLQAILDVCGDQMTFQIPGKSKLAGKYDKSNFEQEFVRKLIEHSKGTHKIEVHDVLASERHGVVLASEHLIRDGKTHEYRTVHIWRFENGKPVAFYEYPKDLYSFDEIWASPE